MPWPVRDALVAIAYLTPAESAQRWAFLDVVRHQRKRKEHK